MIEKEEEIDENVLERVFQKGELELLIGQTHARTMAYDFQKVTNVQYQRQGNKMVIGF